MYEKLHGNFLYTLFCYQKVFFPSDTIQCNLVVAYKNRAVSAYRLPFCVFCGRNECVRRWFQPILSENVRNFFWFQVCIWQALSFIFSIMKQLGGIIMKLYRFKIFFIHLLAVAAGYCSILECYPFAVAFFLEGYI